MKLSDREKMLAMAVGVTVFVLLNLFLMSAFAKRNANLRAALSQQRLAWSGMKELLGEKDLWAARDDALSAKQPKLNNENAAGVQLYDMIKELAAREKVTIHDTDLNGGVEKTQWYRSVPVLVQTSSSWPQLISFLYALQQPDKFIVCETVSIKVDDADPTKMDGSFKIARWYQP